MHVHVAAFPYLDVTKISIWQPCSNFAVYNSYMLPRWQSWLNVLLVQLVKEFPFSHNKQQPAV